MTLLPPIQLPSIASINKCDKPSFIEAINVLFEPAEPLARYLLSKRPYTNYEQLLAEAELAFPLFSLEEQLQIVNAHPAIGAPPETLSALSRFEQQCPGNRHTDNLEQQVLEELRTLNSKYEQKFGFRFVVFVNGRPKRDIIPILLERMKQNREVELQTAFLEMMKIAKDRLQKIQGRSQL